MNRKVLAILVLALLVLLVARAHRGAGLPETVGGWTASHTDAGYQETGIYRGRRVAVVLAPGAEAFRLDVVGAPAAAPTGEDVGLHGTFDDNASFGFDGAGDGGVVRAAIGDDVIGDWMRHLAAGGSLVISYDNGGAAPLVFPLAGAAPTLAALSQALTRDGVDNDWTGGAGPGAVADVAGVFGLSVAWFLTVIAVFYFLPAVIGYARHSTQSGVILLFNLLLGWTVIGWWVLLFVALVSPSRPQVVGGVRRF